MKHTFKSLAVLFIALFFFNNSRSQVQKIAYVNFSNIIDSMKDTQIAKLKIDSIVDHYTKLDNDLRAEYQRKQTEYDGLDPNSSSVIIEVKKDELTALTQRIQKVENDAQTTIDQKRNEFLAPIIAKAKVAVAAVAKEGGYSYVLDAGESSGMLVLYHHDGDNLTSSVRKKLVMI